MTGFLIYRTGTARVEETSAGALGRYTSSHALLSGATLFTETFKGLCLWRGLVEQLTENEGIIRAFRKLLHTDPFESFYTSNMPF